MRTRELSCNRSEGTIEVVLRKREIGVEDAVISADYKIIAANKYEVDFYYGLTNVDIMEKLTSTRMDIEYEALKPALVNKIACFLNNKQNKQKLRRLIEEIKNNLFMEMDTNIRMFKVFPTEDEVGYKDLEITVEVIEEKSENEQSTCKLIYYIKNIFGDLMRMYTQENVHTDDVMKIANSTIKEKFLENNEMDYFVKRHLEEIEMPI